MTRLLPDWSDLRLVLAMARSGTMAKAGEVLSVNVTTVFRRLRAMDLAAGAPLFEKEGEFYRPTELGRALLSIAERTENDLLAVEISAAAGDPRFGGTVKLTSTRDIAGILLVPLLAEFRTLHPEITVELDSDDRVFDLSRREADMAVRPTRQPPPSMVGVRVGPLAVTAYAAPALLAAADPASLPWIGWGGTLGPKAEEYWLQDRIRPGAIALRCNDFRDRHSAVRAGMGAALLPCFLGDPDPSLVRVLDPPADLRSDLWVMSHPDLRRSPRVGLLTRHLAKGLRLARDLIAGKRPGRGGGRPADLPRLASGA
jgi:DNA-binding transcriptional LysR family regulator